MELKIFDFNFLKTMELIQEISIYNSIYKQNKFIQDFIQ